MSRALGTLFGSFVLAPLLFFLVNHLFFQGNGVMQEQVDKYIINSRVIELFIPAEHGGDNNTKRSYETYRRKLDDIKTINKFIFFSKEYKRYFVLINFGGFDYNGMYNTDRNMERNSVLIKGRYFMVRGNNQQWNDLSYGTKENPMPVFGFEVSPRGYKTNWVLEDDKRDFDVPDDINHIFVEQYLDFFLPPEEFKKLFPDA